MLEKLTGYLRPGLEINPKLYLAALPLSLLASVSTYAAGSEPRVAVQYLVVNLISFSFVGLVFIFAKNLIRPQHKLVLTQLVIFGLLLGLSKAVSTAYLAFVFGLEPNLADALLQRILTPLLGVWVALAIAVITATQAQFVQLREELIAERVRRLGHQLPARSTELSEFAKEATELISQSDSLEGTELAELIRSIVRGKLRPLSHELWDKEQRRTPGFSSRELAVKALRSRPYRIGWVSGLFALGSIQPLVLLAGEQWLLALALLTSPIAIAMWLANVVRRRFEFAKQRYVGSLVATSVVGGFSGSLAMLLIGVESNPFLALTSAWWFGNLIVVVGMFAVAIEDYGDLKDIFAELSEGEIDQEALASMRGIRNRELANLLHSKTQNHLLAQAVRIESGGDIKTELLELRALLDNLPQSELGDPSLGEVLARWEGILAIETSLDRELNSIEIRLIEEAISNAYRHGLATKVGILLSCNVLTISDNGLGQTNGKPGLGSALYSSVASWEIRTRPVGGAELVLKLN